MLAQKRLPLVGLLIILMVSLADNADCARSKYLVIKDLSKRRQKGITFFRTQIQVNTKLVQDVELKIYVLAKDKDEYHLLFGNLKFPDLKRGSYERAGMISDSSLDIYGKIKEFRAEVWYKDRLVHALNSSRAKIKWWKTKKLKPRAVIDIPNMDLRAFLRRLKDEEND